MIGTNLLKNYKVLGVTIFILIIILYISLIVPTYFVQDEAATYFSSKNYIESDSYFIENNNNEEYNTNIFHPSYSSYDSKGRIQFNIEKSITLIYSIFYLIFGEFMIYTNLIFAFLILLVMYLILKKDPSNKNYIIIMSLIFIIFMPLFTIYSISLFTIMFAIFLILLLFYMLLYFNIRKLNILILISLIANLLIFIRLSEFILFLPVFGYLFWTNKNQMKKLKSLFILIILISSIFVVFHLPISIKTDNSLISSHFLDKRDYVSLNEDINRESFASTYEYNIFERAIAYPLGTEVGLKGFTFQNYFSKLFKNFSQFSFTGPFPFFFISLIPLIFLIFSKNRSKLINLTIFTFFILFLFYGPRINYYGFGEENLKSSFYRYFLLFYLLLVLFIPKIFIKIKEKLNIKKIILVVSLISLIYISFFISYNFIEDYNGVNNLNNQRLDQLAILDIVGDLGEKSVFITGYNTDRYVYVTNSDISYTKTINYYAGDYYLNSPLEEDLFMESNKTISRLLEDGYSVYFIYSPYDKTSQNRYLEYLDNYFEIYDSEKFKDSSFVKLYGIKK
jgi:hypothetical protein